MAFPTFEKYLSYNEEVQSSVRRSQMSSGMAKQAKKYTNTYSIYNVNILMTKAQYLAFKAWYNMDGYGFFDIVSPETDLVISARIIEGNWSSRPLGASHLHYVISFNMEYEI